ncbi:hypothetical protein HDU67_009814 [Dinochytrium kinnereticum]|nr:hypothetical protein HDU67_009814 [Dinochytrium kinnereticum]
MAQHKITLAQVLNGDTKSPFSLDDFRNFVCKASVFDSRENKEHSEENLEFWEAVIKYRGSAGSLFPSLPHVHSHKRLTAILNDAGSVSSLEMLWTAADGTHKEGGASGNTSANALSSVGSFSTENLQENPPTLPQHDDPQAVAKLKDEVDHIMKTFLTEGSVKEVNVPAKIRKKVGQEVNERKNYHPDVFRPALEHAYVMMKLSTFPNFVKAASK